MLAGAGLAVAAPAQASCTLPANAIEAENCKTGAPSSEWDIVGVGEGNVNGFATDISVDRGEQVRFKVDASAPYALEIYRLGWYGGAGARKVGTPTPTAASTDQPACATEAETGLVDCDNWAVSATWDVPANATSGIYLAVAKRSGPVSHIVFVVRDDDGGSDLLFQTSDTTWQAYNDYGGNSLYTGSPDGRAYKVSYDRPFTTAANSDEDWLFNGEYPMVRWLERNGYDVSYSTGVDSDRRGAEIREHRAFLSVGHDEYWSSGQRDHVEAARDAGVHLAFFSGNEVFWKTRWEDGHRTLVCYKETHAGAKIDPTSTWTGTWRDPRGFNPEGPQPENALTGTLFRVNSDTRALEVPAADGRLRFWRGTNLASQAAGATAVLPQGTLGYEWDEAPAGGGRPAGLVQLSTTFAGIAPVLQDYGSIYAPGPATHHLTLYRDTNGAGPDALVFGAGTIQWSWGLDGYHVRGSEPPSAAMQQATANQLADMGVHARSLQAGLKRPAASTDIFAPTAAISGPATFSVSAGEPRTIAGSAADRGGGRVGAVEVSTDGGLSWRPASGRERWSYTWTPPAGGSVTPRVRAVDDSGHLTGTTPDPFGPWTPPGGGGAGGQPGAGDRPTLPDVVLAPRVTLGPKRVRMSRRGIVRLRVACPPAAQECRVTLRLKRRGRSIARRTLTLAGGDERRVALKLNRSTRRRLVRKGALRVRAIAVSGGRTTRRSIRLLAPRSRP